jgi:hypothetical protein
MKITKILSEELDRQHEETMWIMDEFMKRNFLDDNVESDRKFIEGIEKARIYLKERRSYRRLLNEVFPS